MWNLFFPRLLLRRRLDGSTSKGRNGRLDSLPVFHFRACLIVYLTIPQIRGATLSAESQFCPVRFCSGPQLMKKKWHWEEEQKMKGECLQSWISTIAYTYTTGESKPFVFQSMHCSKLLPRSRKLLTANSA